jgi:glycosyltransferase involved in cell wall biosynthesis
MKVAIVHDALNQYGGAERVLEQIKAVYPDAPVFVPLWDPSRMPDAYAAWDVRPSWLDRVPLARTRHRLMLPLYPSAIESLDLRGFDVVIGSAFGFAHGVLTGPDTLHVNYCHSPGRFLWDYHRYAERERLSRPARLVLSAMLTRLRQWDLAAAERPDAWIATSRLVQDRIRKFYRKPSTIIPPPVDVGRFDCGAGEGGYYLMLMRLVGWKRPDIVVEACTRLGLDLVVAGDGRETAALKAIAGPTVRFAGRVDDAAMRPLYAGCRAFILPAEEDFGVTPLEAMASGRPVIAYGRGGALDTVVPGVTGMFFHEQSAAALADVLARFDPSAYDPAAIRAHAMRFDNSVFRQRLRGFVQDLLGAAPPLAAARHDAREVVLS